jgi:hypothetical protein
MKKLKIAHRNYMPSKLMAKIITEQSIATKLVGIQFQSKGQLFILVVTDSTLQLLGLKK